jgi:hypothetical protein
LSAGSGLMWRRRLGEARKELCEKDHAADFDGAGARLARFSDRFHI